MHAQFTQAEIAYWALSPMLIVFGAAVVGVLVEAFAPKASRYALQVGVALVGVVAAFVALVTVAVDHQGITAAGQVAIDGPALMFQGITLVFALLSIPVLAERMGGSGAEAFTQSGASIPGSNFEAEAEKAGSTTTEVFPLVVFAVGGMMLFPATNHLIGMFVALEILSLPLYILTGLARRRRLLSQEAALKYFLLGAFASAFFVFGAAMIYGYAGSVYLGDIAAAVKAASGPEPLLVMGIMLVAVGLLFKIGAVPFHSWVPDVYQGAPSPVSGFMASATKLAAFGAMARVFYVAFEGMRWTWGPVIFVIAIITMLVGSVMTLTQNDVKRMLAYSSVSHAGFLLLGIYAMGRGTLAGLQFYLLAYGVASIAAFAVVMLVRRGGVEATSLSDWGGLGRSNPVLAVIMGLIMLSFAGIPLTAGFVGKFALFGPAVGHGVGAVWLVVIAVLMSAVTAFVYARVIVVMFFSDPADDVEVVTPSVLTTASLTACTALTVVLGVWPSAVLDLAAKSSQFLR